MVDPCLPVLRSVASIKSSNITEVRYFSLMMLVRRKSLLRGATGIRAASRAPKAQLPPLTSGAYDSRSLIGFKTGSENALKIDAR